MQPHRLPSSDADSARMRLHPAAAGVAVELLEIASHAADPERFLSEALPRVLAAAAADYAAVVTRGGAMLRGSPRWQTLAAAGASRTVPADLLADVADREQSLDVDSWAAAPLRPRSEDRGMLALHFTGKPPATARVMTDALAATLAPALDLVRSSYRHRNRIDRLEALLRIGAQWSQAQELEPLLADMAQTATRLLGADRSSIFLWDKSNRTLVGRPALGVDELRVPDDAGIVGQVMQTGEPRRVATEQTQQEVNRDVDRKSGYHTRNLVAAPMRSRAGGLIGVFETINKLDGEFTEEDQTALVELAGHAAVALENAQQWEHLLATHRKLVEQAAGDVKMIGESPAIQSLRSTIRRVADTELAVLLLGENGSGKEVISQSIHYLSRRRDQPFIAVNCAAITETLLESELFGHEKGAFTDAHEARAGKFELASGGTLFLDEIGDLSRGGQAKLLRVLEEKIVTRVGGSKPIHTDARVIAATNQNLAEMVRQKRFREDLYFRLNVVTIDLPPLRNRGDDILLLAEHFLSDFSRKARRKTPKLTASARKRLLAHGWPGNVRELRNLMERLAYLSTEDKIEAEDLAFILSPGASNDTPAWMLLDQPLSEATNRFQSEYIQQAITRTRGNMSEAATVLGLHRSNLYRKMRQLGMSAPEE